MRKMVMAPLLMVAVLLLAGCQDVVGIGQRSLDGQWSARIDGETVWLSLRDDRGRIHGSGDWGYDGVYVDGERYNSEVYLHFEFNRYSPIEFEGRVRNRDIEGHLYGSGYNGMRVRFQRDSWR